MAGAVQNRDALVSADDASGRRALALSMIEAALEAVEPTKATLRALDEASRAGLSLRGAAVVALGKAARPMAVAAESFAQSSRGIVIGPDVRPLGSFEMREGEHPVSGAASIANGLALLSFADTLGPDDTVLCLVSGGGSAMAEAPISGITPQDLAAMQRVLLGSGAPIDVVNAVRRRVSRIKGGGLASALAPARVVTIVISDTPGHPLATVASGPTLPPPPVEPSVSAFLSQFGPALPSTVNAALSRGGRSRPDVVDGPVFVAADNAAALRVAADTARRAGRTVVEFSGLLRGDAATTGRALYEEARQRETDVLVAGGETTVRVRGTGRGGRNHEACLGIAATGAFEGGLVAGFGTDGVDGTSGAAGALLDAEVIRQADVLHLDAAAALADNDAASFFGPAGAQILTGPTATNVADLFIYLR